MRIATVGNSRAKLAMFGAGFIEILDRRMTAKLQAICDDLAPGPGGGVSASNEHGSRDD